MRVLIIRHGETDWNKKRLIQGTIDIPLNDVGKSQAKMAHDALENENIDAVFASPLIRARETAEIVVGERNLPIMYDKRIAERKFGVAEGMNIDEIDFDATWLPNRPPVYEGMETFEEIYERIADFFDEIYKDYSDKTVLVVTHGGVSIVCGYYFCGPPKSDRSEYFCRNCVVKEYIKE